MNSIIDALVVLYNEFASDSELSRLTGPPTGHFFCPIKLAFCPINQRQMRWVWIRIAFEQFKKGEDPMIARKANLSLYVPGVRIIDTPTRTKDLTILTLTATEWHDIEGRRAPDLAVAMPASLTLLTEKDPEKTWLGIILKMISDAYYLQQRFNDQPLPAATSETAKVNSATTDTTESKQESKQLLATTSTATSA